ncbi:MAG: hypothetical protein JWR07_1882 [Nevskia sp.]|nr:hypothetical protein [Nevskia sp.]
MTIQILPEQTVRPVTIDGYLVPRVTVHEIAATGQWNVIYDNRFCALAEGIDELNRWLPLIANAQAVAEGYSCHGENSVRMNPHSVQVMCIESAS